MFVLNSGLICSLSLLTFGSFPQSLTTVLPGNRWNFLSGGLGRSCFDAKRPGAKPPVIVRNREGDNAAGWWPPGSGLACLDEEGKLTLELPLEGAGRNGLPPTSRAPTLPPSCRELPGRLRPSSRVAGQQTETQLLGLMRSVGRGVWEA